MLFALLLREASQVVMIPFPKLKNANPLAEQVRYEARLSTSWHDASRSVGVIISIAQKISNDDIAISSAIERVKGILGKQAHHRILWSYSMLMMFTLKVQICKCIRHNMECETNDISNTCKSEIYPCYLLRYFLYLIDRLVSLINLYYISTWIYENQLSPEIHTDPGLVLY